ncbi:hypothetical protein LTR84_001972 [Exophiala bonariae]|uniref:Uncharacterized protein n=1 Tax=Exophiala bonariae TaxID=1690606 RepID=A0AAV9NBV4_9EURO|nr:hypothetical protein LTR84_001972 [Exophiala bonariae]
MFVVSNTFVMPRHYPNINRQPLISSPSQTQANPPATATTPRENNSAVQPQTQAQAPTTPVRNLPPVPPFPSTEPQPRSTVPPAMLAIRELTNDISYDILHELPAVLVQLIHSITQTLRNGFGNRPPHTIQRLAELILHPTKHYKTLPAYLRAMDRIVSVSSTADIFPLSEVPAIVNGVNGEGGLGILWNNTDARNGYDGDSLGSDESLGGALLTPIPWLRNGINSVEDLGEDSAPLDSNHSAVSGGDGFGEAISLGPGLGNGDPLVPEREDGAVTQGELMRMEQEAGVVPLTQNREDTNVSRSMVDIGEEGGYLDEGDVVPHARGPDVVGSVDMGRVGGKDVELHIGSPPIGEEKTTKDPNNAQDVLPTQDAQQATTTSTAPSSITLASSTADSEEFEIVNKESADADADADAMQLDDTANPLQQEKDTSTSTTSDPQQRQNSPAEDGDIVLVDADGKVDDEDDGQASKESGAKKNKDGSNATTSPEADTSKST